MAESERLEELEPGLYVVVRSEDERRRLYNPSPERIRDLLTPVTGQGISARPNQTADPKSEKTRVTMHGRAEG